MTEGNWSGLFFGGCADKRKETHGTDRNLDDNDLEKMIYELVS